jgi:hypothetical protein
MLIGTQLFSQDRYDLFLIKNKTSGGFTDDNSLLRINQIYFIKEDSNAITIYNHYLRFEIVNDFMSVYWTNEEEGVYVCEIYKLKGQYYILKFFVGETPVYYFFYRRYDFLDAVWD